MIGYVTSHFVLRICLPRTKSLLLKRLQPSHFFKQLRVRSVLKVTHTDRLKKMKAIERTKA